MPVFEIKDGKARQVPQKEFKDEQELHKLIDRSLEDILQIKFIRDEYITESYGRIETLAIDESNRPVVIEYKKTTEKGQLVQANKYMIWIKNNPDRFELLVRKNIKSFRGEIDFANPRIICFAQDFNIDDKCLALSLKAELYKYRLYANNVLTIAREDEFGLIINEPKRLKRTKTVEKTKRNPQSRKTIEEFLDGASKECTFCYYELNKRILEISTEIEVHTSSIEILYKTSINFLGLSIQKRKNRIRLILRTLNNEIKDPKNLTKIIPKEFGYGNYNREVFIDFKDLNIKYDINDIFDLIIQSYNTTQ